ncbi:MAG TPA: hypothetical protein VK498_02405 [Ferruginibacter sp.]|nr:hypothetical protein [Ferruginibacter sp.]
MRYCRNLILFFLLFPLITTAQEKTGAGDITGLWKGTLYNDTTKQYYRYEIAITENKGKLSGYSHTWFLLGDKRYYGLKKVKVKKAGDGKIIIEDNGLITNNYPVDPAKNVRQMNVLSLVVSDDVMSLEGPFTTNATKHYSTLTGSISLSKRNDYWQSDLVPHLQELGLVSNLSFVQNDIATITAPKITTRFSGHIEKVPGITEENEINIIADSTRAGVTNPGKIIKVPGDNEVSGAIAIAKPNNNLPGNSIKEKDEPVISPEKEDQYNDELKEKEKLLAAKEKPPKDGDKISIKPTRNDIKETEKNISVNPVNSSAGITGKQLPDDINKTFDKKETSIVKNSKAENKSGTGIIKTDVKNQIPPSGVNNNIVKTKPVSVAPAIEKQKILSQQPSETNVAIEKEIKPKVLTVEKPIPTGITSAALLVKARNNIVQQTVLFSSDSLQLSLFDNGEVDGDTVSVLMNGEVIIAKQRLSTNAFRQTIYIDKSQDSIQLLMYAENLGSIPPNTGLLVVKDGKDIYEIRFRGDYQKNAAIILKRK